MLRQEDVRVNVGRCVGGSFVQAIHLPTGISRFHGPMAGESYPDVKQRFLREIEQELIEQGLSCHIVPA